ncbi:MAG: hypothetical protein QGG40_11030, partial [Myxococcota bacterium]|nr:hypothetical protein [Myxococcota bacterium]
MGIALAKGEVVLVTGRCMWLKGHMGFKGVLTLTDRRLHFSPTGKLDRLVNSDQVEIDLHDVDGVSEAAEKTMCVESLGNSIRFRGKEALWVAERLKAAWHEIKGEDSGSKFVAGERVLVQGTVDIHLPGSFGVAGTVTLTDRRVRVLPNKKVNNPDLDHRVSLDVSLDALTHAELEGGARRVQLDTVTQEVAFSGEAAVDAYVHLVVRGVGGSGSGPGPSHQEYPEIRLASLYRGPLAVNGRLVCTAETLLFVPTSRLDAMVGARKLELHYDEITKIEIKAWPEKRLVVWLRKQHHAFQVPDPEACLQELTRKVRNVVLAGAPGDLRRGDLLDRAVDDFLKRWRRKLAAKEYLTFLERVVYRPNRTALQTGWLILTTNRVLFLPGTMRPSGDDIVSIPLEQIARKEKVEELDDVLRLVVGRRTVFFYPAHGRPFVFVFWQNGPGKLKGNADKIKPPASIGPVLGNNYFLEVVTDRRATLHQAPSRLSEEGLGLGLLTKDLKPSDFPEGMSIRVELAKKEGMFRFRSRVASLREIVSHKETSSYLLVMERPDAVRSHDRRRAPRVRTNYEVEAQVLLPDPQVGWALGDAHDARVVNLTVTGCG